MRCATCGTTVGLFLGDSATCVRCDPCAECKSTRSVWLPRPDVADEEEHPCPVCRPWARGFPGLRLRVDGPWIIEPYGPVDA
jgi:hypothetical protein